MTCYFPFVFHNLLEKGAMEEIVRCDNVVVRVICVSYEIISTESECYLVLISCSMENIHPFKQINDKTQPERTQMIMKPGISKESAEVLVCLTSTNKPQPTAHVFLRRDVISKLTNFRHFRSYQAVKTMDPEDELYNLLSMYLLIKPSHAVNSLICYRILSLVGRQAPQYINYIPHCNFYILMDPILR